MTQYYKQGSNEPSSVPELVVDNLTTNDSNTPLSAKQGVVIQSALNQKIEANELAAGLSTKADKTTTDARLDEIELFALAGL